jgi:biopolymer transport protein ExbD
MTFRRAPEPGSEIEINKIITPMLDFAFQILLFFIFTYHPSQLKEGQMDLSLPDAAQAQALQDANPHNAIPGEDLELPSEITVLVRTQQDEKGVGTISQISVQDKVGREDVQTTADLLKHLKKIRDGLTNPNDIKIQADSRLKYSYVMEVMDVCTRAGFRNVAFGPPPDLAMGS